MERIQILKTQSLQFGEKKEKEKRTGAGKGTDGSKKLFSKYC